MLLLPAAASECDRETSVVVKTANALTGSASPKRGSPGEGVGGAGQPCAAGPRTMAIPIADPMGKMGTFEMAASGPGPGVCRPCSVFLVVHGPNQFDHDEGRVVEKSDADPARS